MLAISYVTLCYGFWELLNCFSTDLLEVFQLACLCQGFIIFNKIDLEYKIPIRL